MFLTINQYEYYNYIYDFYKKEVIFKPRLTNLKNHSISNNAVENFLEKGIKNRIIDGIELLKNAHDYEFKNQIVESKLNISIPTEFLSLSKFNPSELREDLFNIIFNHYNNDDIDLVISGGVDSSLLLAVLADANWLHKVRLWTTKTPDGNDYYFAKKSADSVGAKLNTIDVSYESDFDFNILKESANLNLGPANIGVIPLSFVGKSVKELGGNCLMHGIAGETVSLNIYRNLEEDYLKCLFRDKKFIKLFNQIVNLKKIKIKEFPSILLKSKDVSNYGVNYLHLYHLCCGGIRNDTNRVRNNIEVTGINSFTPYLDKSLEKYMLMEMENRFSYKITKMTSRLAMDKIISDEVVWRKDDQGLRWDPKRYIKFHKSTTDKIIEKHFKEKMKELNEVNAKYLRYLEVASLYSLFDE